MVIKKHLPGKPKKIRAHSLSEKTCCEPKHLLDEIKELKTAEEREKSAKPAKIKTVTICFKVHRAKVLRKRAVSGKLKHPKIKSVKKYKKIKISRKKLRKIAAAKKIGKIGAKAKELRKLAAVPVIKVKKSVVPKRVPVSESKALKPKRVPGEHDIEIIRPLEKPEIELIKYPEREKPLNIVKDFETEADEALLRKGLTEPAQATEPEVSADFRTKPPRKWFAKGKLAPPPRPPMKAVKESGKQALAEGKAQKKAGFWQSMFKSKAKEAEKPEIDKRITKRMMRHKGTSTFDVSESEEAEGAAETAEKRLDIFKGPELQGGRGEWTIKSQLDDVLDLINEKGAVSSREIAKMFGVGLDVVEGWGRVLEENKLIEIHYPAMGEPNFTKPGFVERKEVKTRRKE